LRSEVQGGNAKITVDSTTVLWEEWSDEKGEGSKNKKKVGCIEQKKRNVREVFKKGVEDGKGLRNGKTRA